MNDTYRIGTLAEKIVAVKIGLDGTVTPYVRRRLADGRMADVPDRDYLQAHDIADADFVARVPRGHNGFVMVGPSKWYSIYHAAVIPLGSAEPFASDELPEAGPAGESFSAAAEIRFHLSDHKLTWESENISGSTVINENFPELTIALRLPPENDGELAFEKPLFARTAGGSDAVLSAA